MKKMFILIVLSLSFNSCNNCFWKEKDLGNNILLIEADVEDIFIIYCESKDCCYSGINLIPSKIIEYNYNDQWVIAKSISKGKITYWLLNKEIKFNKNDSINKTVNTYLSAPLDSIRFFEELRSRNIHLKLKKYDANI